MPKYCDDVPVCLRIRVVLVAFVAALFVVAVPLSASPQDVASDYYADGVIDDRHSTNDLLDALEEALDREEPQYGAFADAVGAELDERLLGVQGGPQQFVPGDESAPPLSPFPSPQPPVPGGGPPWIFVVLAGMAGVLLVAGAGSAVLRRVRGDL